MTNSTCSSMVSTTPTPARLKCWRWSISGLGPLIVVPGHVIFLDFAKAFNSVPHERLLLKLDHIGVRRDLYSWIRAFLTNQQQRVVCNGYLSAWSHVTLGVPQGSILGPTLFLVYVNDTADNLVSPVRLFADDCAIYRQVSVSADCTTLQGDLSRLYSWIQKWQLPLNPSKCKAICISNKSNHLYMTTV